MKAQFPSDFVWGVATSASQVEGAAFEDGRGPSIWDIYCHEPNRTLDVPDVACDQYHRYEEDVALMKQLHVQAYRFSFSWSRILPDGTGKVNQAGLDYYRRLLDCLKANGIKPYATIYHWDLPYKLQLMGGFGNRDFIRWYVDYVRILLDNFGSNIDYWITFNEPIAVYVGYALGFFAPGLQDEKYARQCLHHLLVAHGEAVKLFRSYNLPNTHVGITVDVWQHYPMNADDPRDVALAMYNNETQGYGMFLNPVFLGKQSDELGRYFAANGFAPKTEPGDFETIHQPLDFFGLNFYNAVIDHADEEISLDGANGGNFQRSAVPGQFFDALNDVMKMLKEKYHLDIPIIITESGMAQFDEVPDEHGVVHDAARIAYLEQILTHLHQAMQDGADVRGYFLWTLLDNWEWSGGFSWRYGLTRVNFETQERIIKDSGRWYSEVIARGGLE